MELEVSVADVVLAKNDLGLLAKVFAGLVFELA